MGLDPAEVLEFFPEKNEIFMHRSPTQCNECWVVFEDVQKPGCAFVVGSLRQMGYLRPDLVTVEVEETKCCLVGDDECLFRIKYTIV